MYFSPHAVSAFNIETCKLHKSRKYVLNKRHKVLEGLGTILMKGHKKLHFLPIS